MAADQMAYSVSRYRFVDRVVSTLSDGRVVRLGDELRAQDLEGDRYAIPKEDVNRHYLFEWICGVIELVTGEDLVRLPPPDRVGA